jgi:signal transduction histidine kinase
LDGFLLEKVLTTKFQVRLAAFCLLLFLAAILLGWAAQSAWQRVRLLNDELSREQLESYRTADQFLLDLQHLQGLLLRFELRGDSNDWARFDAGQNNLDVWLTQQRNRLYTGAERSALQSIERAYDDYQIAATRLAQQIAAGTSVRELVQAHQRAREELIDRSRHELTFIRAVLYGALTALLGTGLGLAGFIWSGLISPLQRQLLESRELIARQDRLASLGILAAGVAHEIRNPLTAIKARLFTQRKHLGVGTPALDDAEVIGNEIDRLESIVKGFLQFARPAEPELSSVSVLPLLQSLESLVGDSLEARHQIHLEIERGENLAVRADANQLKQVLLNLVQNAADAIGAQGRIGLRYRRDLQRLRGQQLPVVVIEIIDTGTGIPVDIRPRLFDPFFTTKATGTGLGLSIAARIIENHGGAIHYQTEPGRGTTFGVVLPEATKSDAS